MRRLKDYLKFIAWQTGLGYLLLWALTFWALDEGVAVFGRSGACQIDQAKVLFYWVCEAKTPLALLATLSNLALTVTVWAPVYVAAATVDPGAMAIALPILIVHIVGLPLGLFVLVRMMATALDLRRRIPGGVAQAEAAVPASPSVTVAAPSPASYFSTAPAPARVPPPLPPRALQPVPPRSEFGLRSRKGERKPAAQVPRKR
jgi:hypothetical protein